MKKFLGKLRIKLGTAEWEARLPPQCYATPEPCPNLTRIIKREFDCRHLTICFKVLDFESMTSYCVSHLSSITLWPSWLLSVFGDSNLDVLGEGEWEKDLMWWIGQWGSQTILGSFDWPGTDTIKLRRLVNMVVLWSLIRFLCKLKIHFSQRSNRRPLNLFRV